MFSYLQGSHIALTIYGQIFSSNKHYHLHKYLFSMLIKYFLSYFIKQMVVFDWGHYKNRSKVRKLDAMFKIRNGTEINNSKGTYNQMAGQKLRFL